MESLEEQVRRLVQEKIEILDYDPSWPMLFQKEKEYLLACLPKGSTGRIEHFGSTAVPGLAAKPIIDILVEVKDLEEAKQTIAPILRAQGYEYLWRPTWGDDTPPFYAWFIKRDSTGSRTHHIHVVEPSFEHWDRLFFRDYLIEHPHAAQEYQRLKLESAHAHANDRVAYTKAKTAFILKTTKEAKSLYHRL